MRLSNPLLFDQFEFDKDRVDVICGLVAHLQEVECYEVRAKYVGAKKKKGTQGAVYRYAEEHHAYYSLDRSKSIFYNDDDDDLQITLLFCEQKCADSFCTFLSLWYLNNPLVVKYGDVVVENVAILYISHKILERVKLAHYTTAESDSPVQTLEALHTVSTSDSHVSGFSLGSPIEKLQCLECPKTFPCRRLVKCRIKPRSRFKELECNGDNQLAMTGEFRDMFDGKMTIDEKSGEEDIPLFVIRPPKRRDFSEELIGSPPLKRKRVEVVIECRDDVVGEMVNQHLKMGSEKLSGTQFKTFVHVADPNVFCDCLEWKYKDSCKRWEAADAYLKE